MSNEQNHQVSREDKLAKFGPGPWIDEPDHIEWRFEGVPCLMHRHPSSGHWCGYAAVEPGHPWHGKGTDCDEDGAPASVHGGITYADKCSGAVCHVAQPGEPDDVWWLGFDFAHSGDMCPSSAKRFGARGYESYKDEAHVRAEVESLARQVIAARRP